MALARCSSSRCAQRPHLGDLLAVLRQAGHVRRRLGRRRAEQCLQHPLAADDRRGAVRKRRDGENRALAEQAAARAVVGQRHAAEVDALHVRDAVVLRQPLVDERVVGGQQVDGRPVFADDAVEEQLHLALEGQRQRVAVVGKEERIGHDVGQPAQRQPLPGEVGGEGLGARVGQHPPRLPLEHRRLVQACPSRQVQQLVVGDAAPEEERQTRGEREVADAVGAVAPTAGANSVRKRNDGLTRMRCSASSTPVSKVPVARPSA